MFAIFVMLRLYRNAIVSNSVLCMAASETLRHNFKVNVLDTPQPRPACQTSSVHELSHVGGPTDEIFYVHLFSEIYFACCVACYTYDTNLIINFYF